jgi:hypothetical protein
MSRRLFLLFPVGLPHLMNGQYRRSLVILVNVFLFAGIRSKSLEIVGFAVN